MGIVLPQVVYISLSFKFYSILHILKFINFVTQICVGGFCVRVYLQSLECVTMVDAKFKEQISTNQQAVFGLCLVTERKQINRETGVTLQPGKFKFRSKIQKRLLLVTTR